MRPLHKLVPGKQNESNKQCIPQHDTETPSSTENAPRSACNMVRGPQDEARRETLCKGICTKSVASVANTYSGRRWMDWHVKVLVLLGRPNREGQKNRTAFYRLQFYVTVVRVCAFDWHYTIEAMPLTPIECLASCPANICEISHTCTHTGEHAECTQTHADQSGDRSPKWQFYYTL